MTGRTARRPTGAREDATASEAAFTGRLSTLPPEAAELFVYGTLQFGPVVRELLGRMPEADVAVARDLRVAALPQRVYPGLVDEAGRMAGGLVLSGLTAADWRTLDAFEDDEYVLRPVELVRREEPIPTYVWTAAAASADWLPEEFAADHLPGYITKCSDWRAEQARAGR
ncbi:gamma-glutamylcyclotransferase family protein [Nocardia alni]|uniref:gamma-glutamylcyclotransferase family protein n=1 Tax=Nocardia alni TaxID=2815723 RepID=UPI001C230524|nr:gamma-glutamylcyclotransferase family protein [Nocardia alni]